MANPYTQAFQTAIEGFQMGRGAAQDIRGGIAIGKAGKFRNEMNDYVDRMGQPQEGVPAEGEEGLPTTRDIVAIKKDYDAQMTKLGAMKGMEAQQEGEKMWAKDIADGYDQFVGAASNAMQNGDHDAAAKLMERGFAMLPNGMRIKAVPMKDGKMQVEMRDEVTGDVTGTRVMSQTDLVSQMVNASGDYDKAHKYVMGQLAWQMENRKFGQKVKEGDAAIVRGEAQTAQAEEQLKQGWQRLGQQNNQFFTALKERSDQFDTTHALAESKHELAGYFGQMDLELAQAGQEQDQEYRYDKIRADYITAVEAAGGKSVATARKSAEAHNKAVESALKTAAELGGDKSMILQFKADVMGDVLANSYALGGMNNKTGAENATIVLDAYVKANFSKDENERRVAEGMIARMNEMRSSQSPRAGLPVPGGPQQEGVAGAPQVGIPE